MGLSLDVSFVNTTTSNVPLRFGIGPSSTPTLGVTNVVDTLSLNRLGVGKDVRFGANNITQIKKTYTIGQIASINAGNN
jgi:hypothetical protein